MPGELSTLGVSADAERLYRHVLRSAPAALAEHADALGWGRGHAHSAYRALLSARLVLDTADADGEHLVPEPPRVAIRRLIEKETARLEARKRELEDARGVIVDFAGELFRGRRDGSDPLGLETVPEDLVGSTIEHSIRSISGPIRQIVRSVDPAPPTDEVVLRLIQGELARGREMWAIYPLALLRGPGSSGLAWLRGWSDIGQSQRLVEDVPHEFVVFGDQLLLARAEWGTDRGDSVAVRSPLVIRAFTQVFDETWRQSLPVPDTMGDTDDSARLLALLAAGFKDEAIARYLSVSLRTVRRRVAQLMDELGAQTRFQLGRAAERRGLLDSESAQVTRGG